MNQTGSTMVKVIAIMGVAAFLFLFFVGVGLSYFVHSTQTQYVQAVAPKSPFDGARAFADLRKVVDFGPRPPGSEPLEKLRAFIKEQVRAAGLDLREHAFQAMTPYGPKPMMNLYAVVKGTAPDIIILGNHYDTKYFPNFVFVGANDGGSTTAWMIEMARALGNQRNGRTVWLCFFDGEEAFKEWTATDSLYGSREFVEYLRAQGELAHVKAMINVDMIGDCYLGIKQDRAAPEWLTKAVWGTARSLDYSRYFQPFGDDVGDDHVPFRRAGIPAMDVIDFTYGGTIIDHVKNWHTANDTIDKVCGESLQVVGDVIYHSLPKIDAYLDGKK